MVQAFWKPEGKWYRAKVLTKTKTGNVYFTCVSIIIVIIDLNFYNVKKMAVRKDAFQK